MNQPLPNMHDASLLDLHLDWAEGTIDVVFRQCATPPKLLLLKARNVTNLTSPRNLPWGKSSSVNSLEITPLREGHLIQICMQSGDDLEIECRDYVYEAGVGVDDVPRS